MADTTAAAIVDTVSALWPGAEVRLRRGRRADPAAIAEFAVVPSARAPRLLIPVESPSAAARAVLRFSSAISARETAGRLGAAAVLRAGPAALADRVSVYGDRTGSLADHLTQVLGGPVVFSLGIGTARVNRKPVLQVFDQDARCAGFVKIGDSAQARRDIGAEARSLERISTVRWRRLQVPSVIDLSTWSGMTVLLQSALRTSPLHRPREEWNVPLAAMDELADAFAEAPGTLAELPWFDRVRRTAAELRDDAARTAFRHCLEALAELAGERTWPVGAWHGDWTPWNMARAPRSPLVQLWDWERFETGVPRGLDRFHHVVNAVTRRHGTTPRTIRSALSRAGADPLRPGSAEHVLAGTYLAAASARYLPLSEGPGGEHIASRGTAVLDALREWVGDTASA